MAWVSCRDAKTDTTTVTKLTKPITTIGQAAANDIVLLGPGAASSHATLLARGGTHTIALSDRTAGMLHNGVVAKRVGLVDGDRIQLGGNELLYTTAEPVSEQESAGDSLELLQELVTLSTAMLADPHPSQVFRTLLSGLVDLTDATKGFVVVVEGSTKRLVASHNTKGGDASHAVSDSIVNEVARTRQALLVSDALSDDRFSTAKSVVDLRLSSVLCAPLVYQDRLLGVLYLGNDRVAGLFETKDLALLEVTAAQASVVLHHALALNQLESEANDLRSQLKRSTQGEMLGSSPAMMALFKIMRRVAPTDLGILVLGETGTGKELVAREIHRLSDRQSGPFIAINCGAIPENLLESELFGHKKGSFTGAIDDKVGKLEAASGGTLFLDEIGEMPMNLQVKLLRVLQERVIERIGDLQPRAVDLRVVAATHQDLDERIADGRFRQDLFYRLNEMVFELPPLRDRGDDIELLATWFLKQFREQYDAKPSGLTKQASQALRNHAWPGNVRELVNRVKKAVILCDRQRLGPEDLGLESGAMKEILPLAEAEEQFKLAYIREALDLNSWNKAQTARMLGVDARTIFRYIERFNGGEA